MPPRPEVAAAVRLTTGSFGAQGQSFGARPFLCVKTTKDSCCPKTPISPWPSRPDEGPEAELILVDLAGPGSVMQVRPVGIIVGQAEHYTLETVSCRWSPATPGDGSAG